MVQQAAAAIKFVIVKVFSFADLFSETGDNKK